MHYRTDGKGQMSSYVEDREILFPRNHFAVSHFKGSPEKKNYLDDNSTFTGVLTVAELDHIRLD